MINKNLSVGIIMRTKDRPVLLQRALKSVFQQSYTNWHLVIVNDGGDATVVDELLIKMEKEFPIRDFNITVIHHPKSLGMEAASNRGISAVNTDLLIIHDDDDSWSPVFLQRMIAILQKEQKNITTIEGIICHTHRVIEEINGNIVTIKEIDNFNSWIEHGLIPIERMLLNNMFPPISFLFSKKVYDEIGGFDENLPVLGDWDFHLRFLLYYDVWVLPELLAFYHHRLNLSGGSNGNSVIAQKDVHQKYRKYLLNKYFRESPQLGAFMAQREYFETIIHNIYNINSKQEKDYLKFTLDRINFTYDITRPIYRVFKKVSYPFVYIYKRIKR